jgi:hypothetical protein
VNQPIMQMDLRLLGVSLLVLGLAVAAIWWVGRRMREVLGPARTAEDINAIAARASLPPQVVKELQHRGLATPGQLAGMTEMERRLLFSTMAKAIQKEIAPPEPDTGARGVGARAFIRPDELPTLFCPTCSYRIERFTSTPPLTGMCETCGARVIVRRDGMRILLTVLPKDDTDDRRAELRADA